MMWTDAGSWVDTLSHANTFLPIFWKLRGRTASSFVLDTDSVPKKRKSRLVHKKTFASVGALMLPRPIKSHNWLLYYYDRVRGRNAWLIRFLPRVTVGRCIGYRFVALHFQVRPPLSWTATDWSATAIRRNWSSIDKYKFCARKSGFLRVSSALTKRPEGESSLMVDISEFLHFDIPKMYCNLRR